MSTLVWIFVRNLVTPRQGKAEDFGDSKKWPVSWKEEAQERLIRPSQLKQ